jgi:dihydroorotase
MMALWCHSEYDVKYLSFVAANINAIANWFAYTLYYLSCLPVVALVLCECNGKFFYDLPEELFHAGLQVIHSWHFRFYTAEQIKSIFGINHSCKDKPIPGVMQKACCFRSRRGEIEFIIQLFNCSSIPVFNYLRPLMNFLLRQTVIIDPSSPFHLKKADILVSDGVIIRIAKKIDENAERVIDFPNLHVSTGWIDVFSNFCDPGQEYKETLETGSKAAAAGGFTDVFVLPNTSPVVHSKGAVEYLVQKSNNLPVSVHPIAAITKNTEGKELSEMYDMHQSGARVFSDGINSIQSPGLLIKALQYLKAVDGIIIQLPDDHSVNPGGLMNEGIISTRLGLPGRPVISEELMVARDIELAKYSEGKIHFTGISSRGSIELIREAKKDSANITCSVTPYHLCFCDEDMVEYDTNLKVNPPLRTKADMIALRDAVMDGTVDCIATQHLPQDADHKVTEFEYALHGMIGLQTSFAAVQKAIPSLTIEKMVSLFSKQPAHIFGIELSPVLEGNAARLTLFQPATEWIFLKQHNLSRSSNSAFFGNAFDVKVKGIINKGSLFLNEY